MATAPVPQHMQALAAANYAMRARSALRRDVRDGRRDLADVICYPPPEAWTATIAAVLQWQHGWGRHRMQTFLSVLWERERMMRVSEGRTLQSLTARERTAIAGLLGDG